MKSTLRILVLTLALSVTAFTTSCSDDDKDPPVISFPTNGNQYEVKVGESFNFSFNVVAEGGYASHSLESTTGQGTIVADNSSIGEGTKEFTISGSYTASDVAGPDGIKLTVQDNEGAESSAIINVDILN
ncbi:hypothetical protein [Lutimonas sp.]|uniref:hypothetical protein n=1 Tax=Lutimonas sp. TaxID=1872403 RepID=UPI003D9ABD99